MPKSLQVELITVDMFKRRRVYFTSKWLSR